MTGAESMIHAAVCCHMGRYRYNNEDNFYLDGRWKPLELTNENWLEARSVLRPALFAVFDGMGGEQHGETAAYLAASWIHRYRKTFLTATDLEQVGGEKIAELCRMMWRACEEQRIQMGSTMAVAALRNDGLYLFGLGDSRIYLLNAGVFTQITEDHTLAAEAEHIGLTGERARLFSNSRSHQLTQYFGMDCSEFDAAPCRGYRPLHPGMKLLLCSDGLSDALEEGEIANLLAREEPTEAAQSLVDLALDKGGKDNITAMVLAV